MSIERTLSIIKPDAVARNIIGKICARLEENDLRIIATKMLKLDQEQAMKFYAVHQDRPFFMELVTFIASAPILAQVLEGDNAVSKYRTLMGATNPQNAAPGTIRHDFAADGGVLKNIVHGSDSIENSRAEIAFFFKPEDLVNRID